MMQRVKEYMGDVMDFLLPRYCPICRRRLTRTEPEICLDCLCDLPKTNAHLMKENPIEKLFWTFMPIERATSYFFYESMESQRSIHQLKYYSNPRVGEELASIMAAELQEAGFFDGIDFLIPMPLHWKRKLKRGYNQCDYIARGISKVTGIPVAKDVVERTVNNKTQTRQLMSDRKENVENIFRLKNAGKIEGKHVLLVDDVITTGSTAISCGAVLAEAKDVKISVISLGYAGRKFLVSQHQKEAEEETGGDELWDWLEEMDNETDLNLGKDLDFGTDLDHESDLKKGAVEMTSSGKTRSSKNRKDEVEL